MIANLVETCEPDPNPQTPHKIGDIILTKAEIKMLLRLRQLPGECLIMLSVKDGTPYRLTVLPKTEVLA